MLREEEKKTESEHSEEKQEDLQLVGQRGGDQ